MESLELKMHEHKLIIYEEQKKATVNFTVFIPGSQEDGSFVGKKV